MSQVVSKIEPFGISLFYVNMVLFSSNRGLTIYEYNKISKTQKLITPKGDCGGIALLIYRGNKRFINGFSIYPPLGENCPFYGQKTA